ncbi:MAG: crossover junction endodeoxyribonuclease RuvC [Candidatus Fermentibacteraceae bacterium]
MAPGRSDRWLGIDPGLRVTGYGVLESGGGKLALLDAGTIRSTASRSLPYRINELYESLLEVIEDFAPEVMGLEEVYSHYRHPRTAIIMAHARGALCLAAQRSGLEVVSIPASRIKKMVTGSGRAGKQQVSGMVRDLLGIEQEIRPDDVSDALAAAIAVYECCRHDR